MTNYNKELFKEASKKMGSDQGVYSAIRRKEKKFKAVKPEILLFLVGDDLGIKLSKYEKDESILDKVNELLSRNDLPLKRHPEIKSNNPIDNSKITEIDPYSISLSKFNLYPDLARECKVKKPYSKEINHAILNLEDFIRKKMNLDDKFYGKGLIEEAKKQGVFKRNVASEEEGLYFLFRSSFQWLRNGGAHKKRGSEKEECFKIILFTDYLIRLFDELYDKNVLNRKL